MIPSPPNPLTKPCIYRAVCGIPAPLATPSAYKPEPAPPTPNALDHPETSADMRPQPVQRPPLALRSASKRTLLLRCPSKEFPHNQAASTSYTLRIPLSGQILGVTPVICIG